MSTRLTEALNEDARRFLPAIDRHRMAPVEQSHETLRAALQELLVNADLRNQFYRRFAHP